jgi:hypothetical protein
LKGLRNNFPAIAPLPGRYTLDDDFSRFRIPHNGNGWIRKSGATAPMLNVFVDNPSQVRIHVTPAEGEKLSEADYAILRAKIGLEELTRLSAVPTNGGQAIVFAGPRNPRYQQGIQVLFLSMMPAQDVGRKTFSRLCVQSIEWKKRPENNPASGSLH